MVTVGSRVEVAVGMGVKVGVKLGAGDGAAVEVDGRDVWVGGAFIVGEAGAEVGAGCPAAKLQAESSIPREIAIKKKFFAVILVPHW
jgi:hypothetical protein